jgi:hypothetical protein
MRGDAITRERGEKGAKIEIDALTVVFIFIFNQPTAVNYDATPLVLPRCGAVLIELTARM